MKFVSKINDILMLDDENAYFVKSQIELNGENYLLLQKVPDELNKLNAEREIFFAKEIVDEQNKFYLETIESVSEKKQILDAVKEKSES